MLRMSYVNGTVYKIVLCLIAGFWFYNPGRHATHYSYIKNEDVIHELYIIRHNKEANLNFSTFERLIQNTQVIPTSEIFKPKNSENVALGGQFTHKDCPTHIKTAVIVPYRNRPQQLNIFLNYIHHFIQQQCFSYKIFIVDQLDSKPFNRAKLLNIGAAEAMKDNYSCLILHDVDLLPTSTGNFYTCAQMPRHMSSSIDVFRYHLIYEGLFGGVVSIRSDQFKKVNGMSNLYEGWGGEDDDFHSRLEKFNFTPYRFSPELSMYIMLKHSRAKPSEQRFVMLKDSLVRQDVDGLNSLPGNYVTEQKPLYTHIQVHN